MSNRNRELMTKFKARELEVVDAYQFTGGQKDGMALAKLIRQHGGAHATWLEERSWRPEVITISTDAFSDLLKIGDWFLIMENDIVTHMSNDDFNAKYEKVKFPQSVLIWKDIPGFPNWQVSDNGRVRNVGYPGYKRRTKAGNFILHRDGKEERWSESHLGNEDQIKAFFAW